MMGISQEMSSRSVLCVENSRTPSQTARQERSRSFVGRRTVCPNDTKPCWISINNNSPGCMAWTLGRNGEMLALPS